MDLNFCIMLIFLLQLNSMFATECRGAESETWKSSIFQRGLFSQILKDDQGGLILAKVIFKISMCFRADHTGVSNKDCRADSDNST